MVRFFKGTQSRLLTCLKKMDWWKLFPVPGLFYCIFCLTAAFIKKGTHPKNKTYGLD